MPIDVLSAEAGARQHCRTGLPREILAQVMAAVPVAALSGPSFAHEVGRELPAGAVRAGTAVELPMPDFRLYVIGDIFSASRSRGVR